MYDKIVLGPKARPLFLRHIVHPESRHNVKSHPSVLKVLPACLSSRAQSLCLPLHLLLYSPFDSTSFPIASTSTSSLMSCAQRLPVCSFDVLGASLRRLQVSGMYISWLFTVCKGIKLHARISPFFSLLRATASSRFPCQTSAVVTEPPSLPTLTSLGSLSRSPFTTQVRSSIPFLSCFLALSGISFALHHSWLRICPR